MARKSTRTATIKVDADVRSALSAMKNVEKSVGGLTKAASLAAGGFGLGLLADTISSAVSGMVGLAEEANKTKAVFGNLKYGLDGAAKASLGLVDNMTLAQSQVRALELGAIDTADGFKKLTGAGARLGFVMNGDAAKGVEDLTLALARSSPKLLDNLGVILSQGEASRIYSERLGISVDMMSEAQRAEAFRVVGLEKAEAASNDLTIATDDASVAIAQMAVEYDNLARSLGGGVVPNTAKLNTAFEALGDRMITLDIKAHAVDLKDLNKVLAEAGTSVDELGGGNAVAAAALEWRTKLIKEQEQAVKDNAIAEEQAMFGRQAAYSGKVLTEQEHHIELLEAQGASEDEIADAKRKQLLLSKDLLAIQAKLTTEVGVEAAKQLADIDRQVMLHDVRQETRKKRRKRSGGGGGRRKDPLADLFESRGDSGAAEDFVAELMAEEEAILDEAHARHLERFEEKKAIREAEAAAEQSAFEQRVARMQREIEIAEVQGVETEFLEQRLLQMQLERADAEDDINARESLIHAQKMQRLKEEQAEIAKRDAAIERGTRMYVGALGKATFAAIEASDGKGKAFANEVAEFAGSRAKMLSIEAITHFALAAIWAAALNPVKAVAEATAGGIAAAQATALGALAGGLGAIGGGGSVGASAGGIPSAVNTGPARPDSANSAPVSPLEQNGSPVSQQSAGAPGKVVNITVQGSYFDSGGQFSELVNDAASNGGRKLRGGVG